jgi:hypothetical protein
MVIYEMLTTNRSLILVKSDKSVYETANILFHKHDIQAYSYVEVDSKDVETSDINFIIN